MVRGDRRRLLPCGVMAAVLALVASVAACGGGAAGKDEVLVFAASSLTDVFTEAAGTFERSHEGTTITLNFASSAALASQINEGAPADVFASANTAQMQAVVGGGNLAGRERTFATNSLVVAVPEGSTAVTSFEDLAKPGLRVVLAGREVPVGAYAREALQKASRPDAYGGEFFDRVVANVRSEEPNVRAVLVKAQLGEADAVIVYSTDVAVAAENVDAIEIPPEYNLVAEYPVAVVNNGSNPSGGKAFVDFILSEEGQDILARHGFGPAE